ncbi:MAG: SDR family oxidoreductase [Spirochaetia bacterium]|jgi:NAD(P)-dependent dehydrogenase (short-subunit alcohol dehydrogenase family)|nr:SDR family oxidoreductase [Spirochaetia bacterium]
MSENGEDIKGEIPIEEVRRFIKMLEKLASDSSWIHTLSDDERIAFMSAAGKISRPDREEIKKRNREKDKIERSKIVLKEKKARSLTGIRSARTDAVFKAPLQIPENGEEENEEERVLNSPRNCYICKTEFTHLHFFYDTLCPDCAKFNYSKRFQSAPLDGKVVLITGARVKIGYQAVLMMLRAGAVVIAATRFPVDAALRYSKEDDFDSWKERLHLYGLDLRHTPSVEIFAGFIEQNYERLDILINNAAQTVRRPPGFYAHLLANEEKGEKVLPEDAKMLLSGYRKCMGILNTQSRLNFPLPDTSSADTALSAVIPSAPSWNSRMPGIGIRSSAKLSQIPYSHDEEHSVEKVFPHGELDADLQQKDLRTVNSWRLPIGKIHTSEMIEVQLVNAIAPFVLCNRLIPFMKKDYTGQKHIVNVSAMEGKFLRFKKDERHPHTNMAKAALNMLTHTSSGELARHGIYMNAVDTGWVTDEDPAALAALKQELHDFQPPLDIVDGAARVCDPFFDGILTGKHWCGQFLKDYFPIDW